MEQTSTRGRRCRAHHAYALGTQRGDGTATPPEPQPPEELARDAPHSAGRREMCLLFPCALHMLGQGTTPPKPPRAEIPAGPKREPWCPLQPRGSVSITCLWRVGAWWRQASAQHVGWEQAGSARLASQRGTETAQCHGS